MVTNRVILLKLFMVAVLMLAAGCTSRYRLDLYLIHGESRDRVDVEQADYIANAVLGSPQTTDRVVPGTGNVVVLSTGSRGERLEKGQAELLGWDRYLRFEVFLQLPARPEAGRLPLRNNSFAYLKGFYERPVEEKVYVAQSGDFVVDSVTDGELFGTITGSYDNSSGEQIGFDGQFKVKRRD